MADELAADLAALRAGAAFVECTADLVELAGPDRLRLLNGLVTADVKNLAPGTTASGFFTTGQGRILADFQLLAGGESCWLVLPAGTGETIRTHLEKYKVASRVVISVVTDRRHFELRGPRASEVAALPATAGEGFVGSAGAGVSLHLLEALSAEVALSEWLRKEAASGLRRVSAAAVEVARIEDGELVFGVDFSGENFPQETGRDSAVSYSKGCYLGQEVVARIHYRGGVQRLPRGLRFDDGRTPDAGAELLFEGRSVGRATSVTRSPRFGAIGLGLLHQRAAAPGTRLEVGGGEAEVVALPFGSSV
jgi:folate-binding protein YgfZ